MKCIDQKYLFEYINALVARPLMYANSAQWLEGQFYQAIDFIDVIEYDNMVVPDNLKWRYSQFVNKTLHDGQRPLVETCLAADHFDDVELLAQFLRRFVELEIKPFRFSNKGSK